MDGRTHQRQLIKTSLALVLYGNDDATAIAGAIREASQSLATLGLDGEILVIGEAGANSIEQTVREEAVRYPNVRHIGSASPGSYMEALKTGLASSPAALIAVTNGAIDLSALRYLVPLAEQHAIVLAERQDHRDPFWHRVLAGTANLAARVFLGTKVRDCGGGTLLSLCQRAALEEVLPAAEGPMAHAEMLARARARAVSVVEVPVSCSDRSDPPTWPGWRGFMDTLAAGLRFWWRWQFPGPLAPTPRKGALVFGLVLALVAALILWPDNHPLLEPDEGRQAEIPREMLAHGDLLVPRVVGQPYYEKPPLQYWLTAGAYTLFGVHPWVARLAPATAAWLTVLLTFAWGRRSLGPRAAFLGALVLSLSLGFVSLGRTVVLDSLLAACVTVAWYSAHAAVSGPCFRWRWWLISALACGLGILTKGPVALVLLVPPVVVYHWLAAGVSRPRWRTWAVYVALAVLVPAPWYVAMTLRDPVYVEQFLWRANVVRFVHAYDHEQPWWFYLPVMFAITFPWSLLWPALGYFLASKKPRLAMLRTPHLGFCLLLAGWCVLFFSVSGCKSPPYVLPALAPLALMLGVCLDAIIFRPARCLHASLRYARQVLPWRATVLVLMASALCFVAVGSFGWQNWEMVLGPTILALSLALCWWRLGRKAPCVLAWGACAAASLAFLVFPVRELAAGYAARHSPVVVARLIRHLPGSRASPILSFQRTWLSASFYLRREVANYYGDHIHPDMWKLFQEQPEVLVLVENGINLEDFLKELPPSLEREVVLPDPDGTVALVVVRSKPSLEAPCPTPASSH
jgi:dolichol-phosphate mannosyltransferase